MDTAARILAGESFDPLPEDWNSAAARDARRVVGVRCYLLQKRVTELRPTWTVDTHIDETADVSVGFEVGGKQHAMRLPLSVHRFYAGPLIHAVEDEIRRITTADE